MRVRLSYAGAIGALAGGIAVSSMTLPAVQAVAADTVQVKVKLSPSGRRVLVGLADGGRAVVRLTPAGREAVRRQRLTVRACSTTDGAGCPVAVLGSSVFQAPPEEPVELVVAECAGQTGTRCDATLVDASDGVELAYPAHARLGRGGRKPLPLRMTPEGRARLLAALDGVPGQLTVRERSGRQSERVRRALLRLLADGR